MALDIVRRIRGNLHGSIDISELEDCVIGHRIFQRLRRIKQTAFLSYVFPGASHTRFEHSLGVMHMADRAWQKIYANQKRLERSCVRLPNFAEREKANQARLQHGVLAPAFASLERVFNSAYILQALRLAALLHDIGHPPFSHSGERFLPPLKTLRAALGVLPLYLENYWKKLEACWQTQAASESPPRVNHEVYTIFLLDKLFKDIYQNNPHLGLKVEAQDIAAILSPWIDPAPGSPLEVYQVRQLCHELVSGEIDIDRMDYLQRDSRECGVVYGMFDADRILDSLSLYFDPTQKLLHLAIQFSGLAAFEDYLRARQSMYVQLYFHKTSVACEAMLQRLQALIPQWSLPADLESFIATDETNFAAALCAGAQATLQKLEDQEYFNALVDDLLVARKLWKRIYEVTQFAGNSQPDADILQVEAVLQKTKIAYELVSSSNFVTKFRPRKEKELSKNYLRLIKKDGKQFLRVEPIEDYSNLINTKPVTHLHRIYVDRADAARAEACLLHAFYEKNL